MDSALHTLVAVVEHGGFSKAALALHMTQPAVSLQIAALERSFGAKLLERTNKWTRLTPAGRIVYTHAKEILRNYAEAKRLVDDLTQSPEGPIRIGASFTFGEYVLPHVIADFRRRFPRISPEIIIENTRHVSVQVESRELDVGVIEGEVRQTNLEVTPFLRDRMVVIVPTEHRLARRTTVTGQDLADETWIVREKGSGTREMEDRVLRDLGVEPAALMEFGSTQIIKESVEAGLGIAVISETALRKERALHTLGVLTLEGCDAERWFSWVVGRGQFRTKATDVFVEFLTEFVQTP